MRRATLYVLLAATLLAQAPKEFEVASLKPNTSGFAGFSIIPFLDAVAALYRPFAAHEISRNS